METKYDKLDREKDTDFIMKLYQMSDYLHKLDREKNIDFIMIETKLDRKKDTDCIVI